MMQNFILIVNQDIITILVLGGIANHEQHEVEQMIVIGLVLTIKKIKLLIKSS